MDLIKQVIRIGNSAGVLLPKAWLNGKAKVILLEKPAVPSKEVIEILKPYLSYIVSLCIVGSYARHEEKSDSDIDIIGITNNINKRIKKGKYDIYLISQDNLEYSLEYDALPILPMLKEAVPIINGHSIETYSKKPLSIKNLSYHIETTLSALHVIKEALGLAEEHNNFISDNIAYSLMLRLREVHIVDSLIKEERATTKGLLSLLKKLTGSLEAYKAYIRAKNGQKNQHTLLLEEAERIYDYIFKKINQQETWIKRKS